MKWSNRASTAAQLDCACKCTDQITVDFTAMFYSVHLLFNQGAFKDTNLVVQQSLMPSDWIV